MKNKVKILFPILASIITGLLMAVLVNAWTNPTQSPPSGGGALYYSNGNVGIGTTTPSQKLSVDGTFSVSATSTFSGNVGIGTVTPGAKLEVIGKIKATNILGTWVGNTASSYDGNRGGYAAADALCDSNYAGSHVCSGAEFTFGRPTVAGGWFNTFYATPSGGTNPSDCLGWTTNSGSYSASYWYSTVYIDPSDCSIARPFACCRNN
ncbi:hypothetical protein HZB04_02380 [Candidatus Wolfebacteria bacterium]|nr:hypothetical protein [Candidatus Wolfebacteria bacterium]